MCGMARMKCHGWPLVTSYVGLHLFIDFTGAITPLSTKQALLNEQLPTELELGRFIDSCKT